jgi:16S rRNA (guanine527-N7)-methyltransferase
VSDPSAALSPEARAALEEVLRLLAEDRASLSSVTDERAWQVHVEDSLTGLELPELRGAGRIADLGAGAGFPGLALAVALPGARVDLVESVSRKCDFMRRAAEAAGIANANVFDARSEELAATPEHGEAYDAVTARAVARLSTVAELASPLLREGGVLVAWKGRRDPEEEAELERASEALAMAQEDVLDVGDRAGSSRHRHLHLIRKTGPTPADLPRRPGVAKKRPKGRA